MKNSDTPTLQDVARAADVSTATISRVINQPEKVATATRERVQQVIDALGFTPNIGGRILASNRSNTVGAIIPTMANAMFASGLQAFQETLNQSTVTLLVASSGYSGADEQRQIRSLITHGADGLLLIGASRPKETTEFLRLRKIPYVLSWCYEPDPHRLFAGFDNRKAARQITEEVLSLGHRRIAMIAGDTTGNDRAYDRISGVRQAIRQHGGNAQLSDVIETEYLLESGGDAFEQLMSQNSPPSAIVCGNDVLAAGTTVRARQLGIAIPGDVSVTGFDDISLATAVSPQLTTVRVPQVDMGASAAQLLLQLIDGKETPQSIEFETQIVRRESLAAVNPI